MLMCQVEKLQSLSLNNKNEKNRIVNTIPVNIEVNLTISVNSVIIIMMVLVVVSQMNLQLKTHDNCSQEYLL